MTTPADKLAQVLGKHQSFTHAVERNVWVTRCECYEELPTPGIEYAYDALAAHQAAVVLAHLTAEAEAEAAEIRARVREDARRSLTVGNTVTALYEADSAARWLRRCAQ